MSKLSTLAFAAMVFTTACNSGSSSSTSNDTTENVPATADTTAPEAPPVPATNATVDMIKNALVNDLVKGDLSSMTETDRKFAYATADLNGDGKNEIFVAMKSPYFCGNAGCPVFLLNDEGKKIENFSIVDGPIAISNNKTNGWNDLIIPSRGINYVVKWKGSAYPENPSVQPKLTGDVPADAQTILADDAEVYTF